MYCTYYKFRIYQRLNPTRFSVIFLTFSTPTLRRHAEKKIPVGSDNSRWKCLQRFSTTWSEKIIVKWHAYLYNTFNDDGLWCKIPQNTDRWGSTEDFARRNVLSTTMTR